MKFYTLLLIATICSSALAQFPAPCDADKACVGKAYKSNGLWIEVTKTVAQDSLATAMTAEFWMKPTRQPGQKVYLAGIWGPHNGSDDFDSWLVYINSSDQLVFELNGPANNLGSTDNTIATTSRTVTYGQWSHVAAVYDGSTQEAVLYLNGFEVARAKNASYPATRLRKSSTIMVFGGKKSSNDPGVHLDGWLDEIRVWKTVRSKEQIYCNMETSLAGNEAGLIIYYRCNDVNGNMCDATGKGNFGSAINSTAFPASDRVITQRLTSTMTDITFDLKCDSTYTWNFVVTDTSSYSCANVVNFTVGGADARFFRFQPTSATLQSNSPFPFTFTCNTNVTGNIVATARLVGTNRCSLPINTNIKINRQTEIDIPKRSIVFDTLFAGCVSTPYYDSVIYITNNTLPSGTNTNRTITISRGSFTRFSNVFSFFPKLSGKSFPVTISAGQRDSFVVRFTPNVDTSFTFDDTLRVISDDNCRGSGIVVLRGIVREVFRIGQANAAHTKILSFTCPATCPLDLTNALRWNWYNETKSSRNVIIDSVIFPPTIVPVAMPPRPYTLRRSDQFGEQAKDFRFKPLVPGIVNDSVVFYARLAGLNCPLRIVLRFTGRGLANDVDFTGVKGLDFGQVVVGKTKVLPVTFTNHSTTDVMNITFYLNTGDVFTFAGAKTASLSPGQTKTVNIMFQPTNATRYVDKLCLYETRCYTTDCIPVTGEGIIEKFEFSPIVMEVNSVIGCFDSVTHMDVINRSGAAQTISNFSLIDPPGTSKFTHVDANGNATPFPPSVQLKDGEGHRFYFRFRPNNNTQDLSIINFLKYTTSLSGDDWLAKLHGTSVIPKLFVTDLTIYGTIEAGDTRRDTITFENVSAIPVQADTMIVPNGYRIISMSKTLPVTLQPRDSVVTVVEFAPTTNGNYDGKIYVRGSQPCPSIETIGEVRGSAIIVKLDAPVSLVNFSYVRPCDCRTLDLPLINSSLVNNMVIDSMWIDTVGVPGGTPQLFSFSSFYYTQGGAKLPFTIPPKSTDTLHLTYCPRTTAEAKNLTNGGRYHLNAHGAGWNASYAVFLIGKRSLLFQPFVTQINFPPTLVDRFAPTPIVDSVGIPGTANNPDQELVQIDSITYLPDERVFSHTDMAGNPIVFPVIIQPGTKAYPFKFNFKPRAPRIASRPYRERAVIHYSKPCVDRDTTILLTGTSTAPAFGMQLAFEQLRTTVDTFRIVTCDTLHVPVLVTRSVPAPTVDIQFDAVYDTTKLKFTGARSRFNAPTSVPSLLGGTQLTVKDCRSLDSLLPFVTMDFVPRVPIRFNTSIRIDSVYFDTQEILNYLITAGGDNGEIIVDQAAMKIQQAVVDFDSVRVLDCVLDTFTVRNVGDVPVTIDSLLLLPRDVKYISSVPPRNNFITPGDSSIVVIQFCPRDYSTFDSSAYVFSTLPCGLVDSLRITGRGFVPTIAVVYSTDNVNFSTPAAQSGSIGDTMTIPVYVDRDFNTSYHNTTYWLKDIDFKLRASWNPYMLKLLGASSKFGSDMKANAIDASTVELEYSNVDSLQAGKIAELKFLILVPDSSNGELRLIPDSTYRTDSLLFIRIVPMGTITPIQTGGVCNTTTAGVNVAHPMLYQAIPNPAREVVTLRFDIQETVPASLLIYSASGELTRQVLDGTSIIRGGQHKLDVDISTLPAGVYTYVLYAGVFSDARQFVVVK